MKKQELIARYSELAENRNETGTRSLDSMLRLSSSEDLLTAERTNILADVATLALWDAENDQKEIANLLTVATSEVIDDKVRAAALERALIMLELDA